MSGLFILVFLVCLALLLEMSRSVSQLSANRSAQSQALAENLQFFSNMERLIVLGDQMLSTVERQQQLEHAVAVQALLFHPSIQSRLSLSESSQQLYQRITHISWQLSQAAEANDPKDFFAFRRDALESWGEVRQALKRISTDTSARLVSGVEQVSQGMTALTRQLIVTAFAAVLIGLCACITFYLFFRFKLYQPIMQVYRHLLLSKEGRGAEAPLINANSQELEQVFEVVNHLLDARRSLEYISSYDPLTGLQNRRALIAALGRLVHGDSQRKRQAALLYLDLDNFKAINDVMDHSVGDIFLQHIARRISDVLGEGATCARIGGDEFIVLMPQIESPEQAKIKARLLQQVIARASAIGEFEVSVTATVGISLYPHDGFNSDTLIKHAEIAMYHGKSLGRGMIHFFDERMNVQVSAQLQLESDIYKACKNKEFELFYQPQVASDGVTIVGAEALLRWCKADGTKVLPPDLISLAEDNGYIHEIGEWVVNEACDTLSAWQNSGMDLSLAVNISARQLEGYHIVDVVEQALARTRIRPERLELEITESAAMQAPEITAVCLERLKKLGVKLAIDDFGTGYSSLAYLKLFPIDKIKLDRTFVKELPGNARDQAICSVSIGLANSLGLTIIAEGVENQAQLSYLAEQGYQQYQGYYFSRPVTLDLFMQQLSIANPPSEDPSTWQSRV